MSLAMGLLSLSLMRGDISESRLSKIACTATSKESKPSMENLVEPFVGALKDHSGNSFIIYCMLSCYHEQFPQPFQLSLQPQLLVTCIAHYVMGSAAPLPSTDYSWQQ